MKNRRKIFILTTAILTALIFSCAGTAEKPDAQYEFEKGISLYNRGLYDEAVAHFERATEMDPDFGRAYLYIGRSYLNLGRWREALPSLRTAYRISPEETKADVSDIIFDFLFQNASKLDRDARHELENFFELP
jgi:tetratricopeptide (TPR) repeat protein